MIHNACFDAPQTCALRRNGLTRMDVAPSLICARYAIPAPVSIGTQRAAKQYIGYSGETRGNAPGRCIYWKKGKGLH